MCLQNQLRGIQGENVAAIMRMAELRDEQNSLCGLLAVMWGNRHLIFCH